MNVSSTSATTRAETLLSRQRSFWRGDTGRPLLGINISLLVHERFPLTLAAMPQGEICPGDIRTDLFLEDCERLFRMQSVVQDDFPFVASPLDYIPWMEAIMGCPVAATPTSIYAVHCVDNWGDWQWQRPGLDNPWAQKLLEMMQALVEQASGRYYVGPTLMRGPADILIALRGGVNMPLDFIDNLGIMRRALDLCTDAWIEVGRAQHDLMPDSDVGYMNRSEGLHFWAPEKTIWLQEDAVSLLSPSIYREHVLPVDRRIAAEFPAVAYHLHGTTLWAVDEVLSIPEVDVIEVGFESSNSDIEGTFAACKRIEAKKPLIIYRNYDSNFRMWLSRVSEELSPQRLAILVTVANPEEGTEVEQGFKEKITESW